MILDHLYLSNPPWIYLDVFPGIEDCVIPSFHYQKERVDATIRVLRGNKMRSCEELMTEFGAVLQFFPGFGENWNALDECLRYLDEWLPAETYILVFLRPHEILADDDSSETAQLIRVLEETGEWWSRPIVDNGRFNRPAIPFHSIFRCSEADQPFVANRFPELPFL
jgi:hypothetical protein